MAKDHILKIFDGENSDGERYWVKVYTYANRLHIEDYEDEIVYIPDEVIAKVATEMLKYAMKKKLI